MVVISDDFLQLPPTIIKFHCITSGFGKSFSDTFNLGSCSYGGYTVLVWTGVYFGIYYQCNLIIIENLDTNRNPGHAKTPFKTWTLGATPKIGHASG